MWFFEFFSNIIISLVAAAAFWCLSFAVTYTRIVFSETIEKKKNIDGKYSYRIRLTNCGIRDYTEVELIAKVIIHMKDTTQTTYLGAGEDATIPVMSGWIRRKREKAPYQYYTYFPGLYIREKAFREFMKSVYPEYIRVKAENNVLTLDDLFDEYGKRMEIQVFIFGNDAVTGARKMFTSKKYTASDVIEGRFVEWQEENHFSFPIHRKKSIGRLLSKIT